MIESEIESEIEIEAEIEIVRAGMPLTCGDRRRTSWRERSSSMCRSPITTHALVPYSHLNLCAPMQPCPGVAASTPWRATGRRLYR